MAYQFHVSLPDSDRDLIEWLEKMKEQKKLSASQIFRDALIEKKKDWDIMNAVSPEHMREKIKKLEKNMEFMQGTIKQQTSFIHKKGLQEDWFNFAENDAKRIAQKMKSKANEKKGN